MTVERLIRINRRGITLYGHTTARGITSPKRSRAGSRPIVDAAAVEEHVVVEEGVVAEDFIGIVKDGDGAGDLFSPGAVEPAKMFIEEEVAVLHFVVGFGNEAGPGVAMDEVVKVGVGDDEVPGVAKVRRSTSVFTLEDEALKRLPTKPAPKSMGFPEFNDFEKKLNGERKKIRKSENQKIKKKKQFVCLDKNDQLGTPDTDGPTKDIKSRRIANLISALIETDQASGWDHSYLRGGSWC